MKKRVIITIVVLIFISISSLYIINHNRSLASSVEENNKGTLAIMVYDESTSDYIKQDTIPVGNYRLNTEKSTCVANGYIKKYNPSTGQLIYKLDVADQCYVYFDIIENVANVITENTYLNEGIKSLSGQIYDSQAQSIWSVVYENNAEYRYEGKYPDNYMFFDNACSNGKFRIIGVFNEVSHGVENKDLVKVITENSIGNFTWNAVPADNYANWKTSSLYTYLKSDYITSISAIKENYIEEVKWYLGAINFQEGNAETYYIDERKIGTDGISQAGYWQASVGLIYPSDYAYAVLECDCSRDFILYNNGEYNNSTCSIKNWLYENSSHEWTISISSPYSNTFIIQNVGSLSIRSQHHFYAVRPTFYLKPETKVLSGTGTESDPYIVGL